MVIKLILVTPHVVVLTKMTWRNNDWDNFPTVLVVEYRASFGKSIWGTSSMEFGIPKNQNLHFIFQKIRNKNSTCRQCQDLPLYIFLMENSFSLCYENLTNLANFQILENVQRLTNSDLHICLFLPCQSTKNF